MFGRLPLIPSERRRRTVVKLTGLAVFAAPVSVWAYFHYQQQAEGERVAIVATARNVKEMTSKMAPDQLRRHLAEKYRILVSSALPQLSGVKATVDGSDGKYSLYAEHPRFHQRSFSVGPLAPNVRRWAAKNRDELRRADIVKVRVGPHELDVSAEVQTGQR